MTPPRLARFRRIAIWYLVSRCGGQVASLDPSPRMWGCLSLVRRWLSGTWSAARRRDISLRAHSGRNIGVHGNPTSVCAYLPKLLGTGPAHPCRHCFCQLSQTLSGPRGGCEMSTASTPFGVSAGRFRLFHVVSRAQIQRFRRSRCFMQRVRFPAAPCHTSFEPAR